MILDFDYVYKKYDLNISGILHVGGHYGNVISDYRKYNVNNIVLFEPLSNNFSILTENVKNFTGNIISHQVALGNENKKVIMNVSDNQGQSSSILNPKVHLTAHPEVSFIGTEEVEMKKLDDYNYKNYNMMVVDVQGYELEVFRGGIKTLQNIDYIFCEVNCDEVYEGNAKIEEVDEFLFQQGFERVEVEWYYSRVFGDAFYIRKNIKKKKLGDVSIICACKNRYEALKLSLNSWLMFDEIGEIIIVDWGSDNLITDLLDLDKRIKIIRVDNKKYFNLSQPLNLAASISTGKYILKMDCDYIINPYFNFFENYQVDENNFLTGNSSYKSPEYLNESGQVNVDYSSMSTDEICDYVNSYSHYFMYLKGLLFITKDNFLKIGGFDEDIDSYGWEDGEIIKRLEKLNLKHKKISYDYNLIHIPHPDKKRIENCKEYNIQDENYFTDLMSSQYSKNELPFQVDYVLVSHYTEKNKKSLIEKNKLLLDTSSHYGYKFDGEIYLKPKTKWIMKSIKENYYIAKEKKEYLNMNKLEGFPTTYYITLNECIERQKVLEEQFEEYGISFVAIKSERFSKSNDNIQGKYLYQLNDGTKGCCVSHLKAIKKWYEETNEDYAFFCEDDISLETVPYWNFTWEEFIESIPEDVECIQLFNIRSNYDTFELRERYWDDWGASAYILTRDYAKKIIDTYIKEDYYLLEVPNQEVMPLIENILFASIGKTYTIPLFVENIKFGSTFEGFDDDVKSGNKTNHLNARNLILEFWKNKEKVIKSELEQLLDKFSIDTENDENNFNLGIWYENNGHTAPALSYYLRCAERSENEDLIYEALIRGSFCYEKQGERSESSRSLLWQAQAFRTDRPEAYFLLSRYSERKQWWQDCYINADLALRYCNFNCNPLRTDVEYPGKYGLLYEKAISAYWWGKDEESTSLFTEILERFDDIKDEYKKSIHDNLKKVGVDISPYIKLNDNSIHNKQFFFSENFDWGDLSYEDIITIDREIIHEQVYRFWRDVKEDDIVVDIGASVGAFVCSIFPNKPKKVYCVEPSKSLLKTLLKNSEEYMIDYAENPLFYLNCAIIDEKDDKVNVFGSDKSYIGITFNNFIKKFNIEKINFLKIDCEGGEYNIFNDENIKFLQEKVEFISMEVHLNYDGCREKFKNFRDKYLSTFKNYKVMSCTRQSIDWGKSLDIKEKIFENDFIDNYTCEFMIYILNTM